MEKRISTSMELNKEFLSKMKEDRFLRFGVVANHKKLLVKFTQSIWRLELDYRLTKNEAILHEISSRKSEIEKIEKRIKKIVRHCGKVAYINDLTEDEYE